jgi:hypothetical protein
MNFTKEERSSADKLQLDNSNVATLLNVSNMERMLDSNQGDGGRLWLVILKDSNEGRCLTPSAKY